MRPLLPVVAAVVALHATPATPYSGPGPFRTLTSARRISARPAAARCRPRAAASVSDLGGLPLQEELAAARTRLAEMASANAALTHEVDALQALLAAGADDIDPMLADGMDDECLIGETCEIGSETLPEFLTAYWNRVKWLVGLLVLQSASSIVLSNNQALVSAHPTLIYFLTLLVGAGGNAGNQSAVRIVRGLAVGAVNEATWRPCVRPSPRRRAVAAPMPKCPARPLTPPPSPPRRLLVREAGMAVLLAVSLFAAGYARVALSGPMAGGTPATADEALAIAASLFCIVLTSVVSGAALPMGLRRLGVDPSHSTTTIQVIMDCLGVVITVGVCYRLLG
jgi:cation transporter-like permease